MDNVKIGSGRLKLTLYDEISNLLQTQGFGSKLIQYIAGILPKLMCELARLPDTQNTNIGRLVVLCILSGSFAERGSRGFCVQYVVYNLERQADTFGKMIQ